MPSAHYLVTYDISDDRLRSRVSRLLTSYGLRVQFSVFDCALNDGELRRMLRELAREIGESGESVLVFRCAAMGTPTHPWLGQTADVGRDYWLA